MHQKNVVAIGQPLDQAKKALIMLHGRGATAEDILSLSNYLKVEEFAVLAPQANGNSWYPFSFLSFPSQNEPWLTSALDVVHEIVDEVVQKGIEKNNIYFAGFSQGACLSLEYVCRNAMRYGGVAAFSGGLIGNKLYPEKYKGDFGQMPIFIGSSDPDPHIPVERVLNSAELMKNMNADVTAKIYSAMGHTVTQEEIDMANKVVFRE